jgi:hypothetical protein
MPAAACPASLLQGLTIDNLVEQASAIPLVLNKVRPHAA